jgi:aryl-alcohol dehydrogenase-like predicted oxidoreductase
MERRKLGRTDMEVSVLGFGGAEIEGKSLREVERLLGGALDAGLNLIDTAECYGDSEELIGKAISHRRADYYLITKCGHANLNWNPNLLQRSIALIRRYDHANFLAFSDWHPKLLRKSIERSLRRLRTDYLDAVQLHSCKEDVLRRDEVIAVLEQARAEGKVRYLGYSGDGVAALYAVQSGLFAMLQLSVSIADQESIDLVLPRTIECGIGVIAKRPIANAVWLDRNRPSEAYLLHYWERIQRLDYDFLKTDANTAAGIVLRFPLSVPGVHTAIVGTAKPGRWHQNAALIAAGPLPASLYEAIRTHWKEQSEPDWTAEG